MTTYDIKALRCLWIRIISVIGLGIIILQFARAAEIGELAIRVILDYSPEKKVYSIHRHQIQDDMSLVTMERKSDVKTDMSQLKRNDGLIGVKFIEVDGEPVLQISNHMDRQIRFIDELVPIELQFALKPKSNSYVPTSGIWRKFALKVKEGIPPKKTKNLHLKDLDEKITKSLGEIYKYPHLAVRCRMVLIIGDDAYSIVDAKK